MPKPYTTISRIFLILIISAITLFPSSIYARANNVASRHWASKVRACEVACQHWYSPGTDGEISTWLSVGECRNECLSPLCAREVYSGRPLEPGEIDLLGGSFKNCFIRENRRVRWAGKLQDERFIFTDDDGREL